MGTLLFHEVRDLVGLKGSFPDYSDFALVEIDVVSRPHPVLHFRKRGTCSSVRRIERGGGNN